MVSPGEKFWVKSSWMLVEVVVQLLLEVAPLTVCEHDRVPAFIPIDEGGVSSICDPE